MIKRLRVETDAEAELLAAADWYESRRPSLGAELIAVVDEALDIILDAPDRSPRWRQGHPHRRHVLPRFPYAILYRVEAAEIVVVAFAHQRRRPGYWLSREG